uniref:C2 domain-containing protein n=1 Tax=Ananas comosus var. bracteatus TaxID=296719 RepID=A0A6V7PL91_ANACO|nr:unnamed protein product [Ananas comosus var. bracteatus]
MQYTRRFFHKDVPNLIRIRLMRKERVSSGRSMSYRNSSNQVYGSFLRKALSSLAILEKSAALARTVSRVQEDITFFSAGMVEFIGILKVKVIKGTNLAIRDMLSSDPYVVLTIGQQKA